MKLETSMLIVQDMALSKHFYETVLSCKAQLDLGTYITFHGGPSLMTEGQWQEFHPGVQCSYGGNTSEIYFETEELDKFLQHLATLHDIEFFAPLTEAPWGQRTLRLYDPDKHIVEVAEDMKVVTKRFLQSGMSVEDTVRKVMFPREFVEMCQRELDSAVK